MGGEEANVANVKASEGIILSDDNEDGDRDTSRLAAQQDKAIGRAFLRFNFNYKSVQLAIINKLSQVSESAL